MIKEFTHEMRLIVDKLNQHQFSELKKQAVLHIDGEDDHESTSLINKGLMLAQRTGNHDVWFYEDSDAQILYFTDVGGPNGFADWLKVLDVIES